MIPYVTVALGGAAGSMLRYAISKTFSTASFPAGTLLVNLTGCFLIGLLWASLKQPDEQKRLLFMTGFCGGFTTFSAFTLEGVQLMMAGRWLLFTLYTTCSLAGGMLATFLGYKISN